MLRNFSVIDCDRINRSFAEEFKNVLKQNRGQYDKFERTFDKTTLTNK